MKQGYMLVSKKGYMVVLPKVDDGVKAGVGASVEERGWDVDIVSYIDFTKVINSLGYKSFNVPL